MGVLLACISVFEEPMEDRAEDSYGSCWNRVADSWELPYRYWESYLDPLEEESVLLNMPPLLS